MSQTRRSLFLTAAVAAVFHLSAVVPSVAQQAIVNVSYDPTRELYREFNAAFARYWQETKGESVRVQNTHSGSGQQARAVIDGLEADVVTLALQADIDAIAKATGKIRTDWRGTLANNNAPYTSTIVFLVRKGNPKGLNDWGDLIKDGVEVITPNPKSSGGARWNFLAAWAWALKQNGNDEAKAREYVTQLFRHVPVLDPAARGATTTFVQRGIGDVLLAWENEAFLAIDELGPGTVDIVVPPLSILAEPPVAIVDRNVDGKGTREVAKAYLDYLYTPEAQKIIASNYYRPRFPEHASPEDVARFPEVKLITIDEVFGGWAEAQKTHFADGGVFDEIHSKD